jgi:Ca2+-binding EF-hand superfamily protein
MYLDHNKDAKIKFEELQGFLYVNGIRVIASNLKQVPDHERGMLFDFIDKNKDGTVDLGEIREAAIAMGLFENEVELEKTFNSLDFN